MSVFNPEFLLRVQARREEQQISDARERAFLSAAPPIAVSVEPVRTVFTGAAADALRRIADARHESPDVLARAIVERALHDGAAEELLGADRAEDVASGHGRRPVAGQSLTRLQCAVLFLVGGHGGATGWCGWSAAALAGLMPAGLEMTGKALTSILLALARHGLIERGPLVSGAPRHMRLTDLGRAVYAELSGDDHG